MDLCEYKYWERDTCLSLFLSKMHISFTSLFAIASLTSLALASNGKNGHQHGHKDHGNKAPKGKVFDHFLQIWFENQVNIKFISLLESYL